MSKMVVETECQLMLGRIPQCQKMGVETECRQILHPTMLKMGVETECRDIFYARNSQCRTWSLRQNVNIYYSIAGIKIGHCLKMHYFEPFLLIRLFVYQHVKNCHSVSPSKIGNAGNERNKYELTKLNDQKSKKNRKNDPNNENNATEK